MGFEKIKSSFLSAIAFFGMLGAFTVGYSLYVSELPAEVGIGSGLSSIEWNKMRTALSTLDTNLSKLSFSGGKVGIGTANPVEELEVNGNVKATPVFGQWQHGGHQYTTSTATTVLFQTETVNTNSEYFELLADQSGILVKKAGYYYFEGSTDAMTSTYTGRFDMIIKSNTVGNVAYGIHMVRSAGTNTYTNYAVSGMAYVPENTTVSMRLETASAADWFIHSGLASMRIYKMN